MTTETSVDGGFARMSLGTGRQSEPAGGDVRVNNSTFCYNMNHGKRGKFLIINNKIFEPSTQMNERTGTDVDAANLTRLFKNLGFDVQRKDNLKAKEMHQLMIEAGRADHSDCDCFGVAILSHGEDQGIVFGTDCTVTIENLIEPIKGCISLAGKPKLVFIQACRGSKLDDGVEFERDAIPEAPRNLARIPLEADFLFAYSTTPGFFSWRNSKKGTWFVQAVYKVFNDPAFEDLDILQKMTRVNHAVAFEFESNAAQPHMTRKKQASSVVSQLTKDLYLKKK